MTIRLRNGYTLATEVSSDYFALRIRNRQGVLVMSLVIRLR